ncbi:MAG TPA: ABC transporter permease [Gemmatimonadales bacterium]|nr:ABC transporter permease [Gemmatimonadales bacterium]
MKLLDAVREAAHTIRTQKLKTAFSAIGVLIGVTFLIAVVSIIEGMNSYMEDKFANGLIGLNTFQLARQPMYNTGNVTEEMWRDWQRRPRVRYDDADYIEARLTTPAVVSRYCRDRATISAGGKVAKDIDLIGTDPQYFTIKNYDLAAGRIFTPQELRTAQPVMVIGSLVGEKLFPGQDPLGKEITVSGIPYRVIGVVEPQGTLFGLSMDKFVVTPYSAPARRFICPIGVLDYVSFQASDPQTMLQVRDEVEGLMRQRRGLRPGTPNNFDFTDSKTALEGWNKISRVLLTLLPALVIVGVVVGGIVIMNIMLVSVTERVREIGVRKALGARRRDILTQFLVESASISTFGAACGILLGIGLAFLVKAISPLPATVAPWSVALGVGIGMSVGIIAGVYPASRAARLDPIVALRSE